MLSTSVLVLNRSYQPMHVTSVRRALAMLYVGAARAIAPSFEALDFASWANASTNGLGEAPEAEFVRTASLRLRVPRVILLSWYDRLPMHRVRYSRQNIYLRDDFTCQYCRQRLPRFKLNLDHVLPRSRGGDSTWENIVCACKHCNRRKGNRTPDEARMPLARRPRAPDFHSVYRLLGRPNTYPEWRPFLGDDGSETPAAGTA